MSLRIIPLLLAGVGLLAAQDPPGRVGRLSYIQGAVSFQPAGVTDWAAATVNRPLSVGDQLFVDNGGYAEVDLPGTRFFLGSRTAFQFLNLDDRTVQVRLSEGPLEVSVRKLEGNLEIDGPNLAYTVQGPGDYRLDANPDTSQTSVVVRAGGGQVTGNGGSFALHAGQEGIVVGQDQSAQYNVYQAPAADEFDNWVVSREHERDRYAHSRYVSADMVGAEDLDQYGSWRSVPEYGQVWVPSGVASGWAPYQDGSWAWTEPYGWTWVDAEPWGFAPFHYGRWAYVGGSWGWCPGPVAIAPVYAPALVAWVGFGGGVGVSVGFGGLFGGGVGVGWFPLGPRDVYIPSYGVSAAYVNRVNISNTTYINRTNITNVYNNYTRTGSIPVTSYMNRTAPNAVMAVPQNALGNARPVQQAAVRIQPNQFAAVKSVQAAPHVAPQVASVLGRAPSNVPRPAAAVLSRPVVARITPPAPVASFQQRQALLAKNPGTPLATSQLHQMAPAQPAPVRVVANARPVTPHVVNTPAPHNLPAAAQNAARPATPAPTPAPAAAPQPSRAASPRPFEPPTAQSHVTQPNRPSQPPTAQSHVTQPNQPPTAQSHVTQPGRPYQPPTAQSHVTPPQSSRPSQPPPSQPHVGQQRSVPPPVQHSAPPSQPHVAQQRSAPPPVQHSAPPPQPHVAQQRPAPPPQQHAPPQPRGQADRSQPPQKEHH